METVERIFNLVVVHGPDYISAIIAILTGVIALSLLIPGEQPEAALRKVVDFLSKFSRKPKE